MRSAEVTGARKTWSEFSRRPPLCVTAGVAAVESSLSCVMSSLVYPSDASISTGGSGWSGLPTADVSAATGLPEESSGATVEIALAVPSSASIQLDASMRPEIAPPSKVTTVSVLLRVSAANASANVASATHVVPAASESEPTSRPPAGTVYVIVDPLLRIPSSSRPRASCDISTVLPALSASVGAAVPPWADMPVTVRGTGDWPVLSVTVHSAMLIVAVTSPVNVTSVVSASRAVAVNVGTYIAVVEPPAKAMPTSLLIEDGVTV